KTLLSYFGEQLEEDCENCDICKNPPEYFDGTIIAQKVCSVIARLKEQESINTVVDVLRGAQNAQIHEKGYQNVKTYGAAKDISWRDLQNYVIQLINQGVLEIWFHENGRLILTPLAKAILFKGKKVKLANIQQATQKKTTVEKITSKSDTLFEKLRQLRLRLAKEENVPAYIIFSDASLKDMVKKTPINYEEFSEISGVGKAKLEKYADDFIKVINRHFDLKQEKLSSHHYSYKLYREKGLSLAEIAQQRGLSEGTVFQHFIKMYEMGHDFDFSSF